MCPGRGHPKNHWGVKLSSLLRAYEARAQRAVISRCRRRSRITETAGGKDPNITVGIGSTKGRQKAKCFQTTLQNQTGKRGTEMVAQLSRWCSPSTACMESFPSASTSKTD